MKDLFSCANCEMPDHVSKEQECSKHSRTWSLADSIQATQARTRCVMYVCLYVGVLRLYIPSCPRLLQERSRPERTKESAKKSSSVNVGTLKKKNTVEMARNSEVGKHSNKTN